MSADDAPHEPVRTDGASAAVPARSNLVGNPSDLYGGVTLACSVPLFAHCRVESADVTRLVSGADERRIARAVDLAPAGDVFDLARSVLRSLDSLPVARISFSSEIPMQSGMAGATALLMAILAAVSRAQGAVPSPYELAERSRAIERYELGVTCGWVDHYMAAFGGLRFIDFAGKALDGDPDAPRLARVESLPEVEGQLPFVLAFTGVRHDSGAVHAPIRDRWARGEPAVVRAYERVAELGREGRDALTSRSWGRLGELMNENHAIQRALGGSGEVNDRLIDAARTAGAPGAKLAGAGHGGTIVALWTDEETEPLVRALRRAGAAEIYRPEPVAPFGTGAEAAAESAAVSVARSSGKRPDAVNG